MSKLLATLVATMFATAAFAQNTPGLPPTQPAAGTGSIPMMKKKDDMAAPAATTEKKEARAKKRAARKMKRDEKVGDKPLN